MLLVYYAVSNLCLFFVAFSLISIFMCACFGFFTFQRFASGNNGENVLKIESRGGAVGIKLNDRRVGV
jgi:hypothetical protein